MTYDYVNRYSTTTEQQAGNRVVTTVMDYYEQQGITMEKCNVGFPMNAKYFTLTEACDSSNPIGCFLPGTDYYEDSGVDNYKSGWVRFNPGLDSTLGTKGTEWATKMRAQWEARPIDGSTEITADVSNAWVDETNNVFWTWLSDSDMKTTCQNWVTSGKVGGAMVWSLNQVTIHPFVVHAQMLIHFRHTGRQRSRRREPLDSACRVYPGVIIHSCPDVRLEYS